MLVLDARNLLAAGLSIVVLGKGLLSQSPGRFASGRFAYPSPLTTSVITPAPSPVRSHLLRGAHCNASAVSRAWAVSPTAAALILADPAPTRKDRL